ncbi:MAG: glycosyltransferase family 2 protein, partial [Gammaproteobacteria bacterium]|nr:glycosyltransferase family 2 protein [Gammaproteobacteria bacterium]
MKVAICICTYRRPDGLRKLLEHINTLETTHTLSIAVADNDEVQQAGVKLIDQMRSELRWPVTAQAVPEQGISFSRNTAARLGLAADPELVAFIDDDEWPEPRWLDELVRVQQVTGADAVGGPTKPAFPEGVTESIRDNEYYGADMKLEDGSECQLEAAGNFLIRAATLRAAGPLFFHPDFARSGGEDLAFFMRLQQTG